ncbi:ATPase [Acidipropionibacterium acidipropionici ATCC 4875]|uniref:ATPase n=1 Tax=Acidipropionibacterium acidipropionici (strain ATCC 4875 / DSM 20272 / JCM 6432 / NBRC 12425 / NCIMB 8070 / 4) TaxID=1171373 RepID=K7RMX1_ACIA4|nr:AAA family ATPase [Acidipropionibacterium acidipropionici]AFV89294.1 ATPase [Acidipropionibacterium acidipropionici ATCC 4875]
MNPTITLTSDGHGTLTIDGAQPLTVTADTPDQASQQLIRRAARFATSTHQNLTVTITDDESTTQVDVTADGHTSDPRPAPEPQADLRDAEAASTSHADLIAQLATNEPDHETTNALSPITPQSATPQRGDQDAEDHQGLTPPPRRSFLTTNHITEPATHGWRGLLNHIGLRISPGPAERSTRDDANAVSQRWPGVRTIAVVNGKGGAGKTPTTALLSAVLARWGGSGVIAWDTNQTRGTLGWRTEQGPHNATVLDLLPQTQCLLSTSAQSADLAHYTHHQAEDRYDVLRSQPMELAADQRITPDSIDQVLDVLGKYYRLVIADTGNDESDPAWLQTVSHADLIVVATSTRDDHAEAGALLLEKLAQRGDHEAQLAANSVAVITQADPRADKTDIRRITDGYTTLTRQVVTIPHDPAMVDGWLRWNTLRPTTQRAWLRAAAAVARGL